MQFNHLIFNVSKSSESESQRLRRLKLLRLYCIDVTENFVNKIRLISMIIRYALIDLHRRHVRILMKCHTSRSLVIFPKENSKGLKFPNSMAPKPPEAPHMVIYHRLQVEMIVVSINENL